MHVGTFGQLRLRQSTFQSQVSKIHTVLTFCSREHDCSFRLMYMRRTIPCRIPRSRGDSHFVSTVCILRMESAGSNLMVLVTSTVQLSRGSSFREGNAARLSGRGCGGGLAACGLGRVAHLVASVSVRRGFCCYPYSSADICQRQADVNREGKTVGNTDIHRRVADTLEGIKRKTYIDNKE
jgi:hypothetical protein